MNLPDWATHVAVNKEGTVYAFDHAPTWEDGYWQIGKRRGRRQNLTSYTHRTSIHPDVARLLRVAIPRPEREENESHV